MNSQLSLVSPQSRDSSASAQQRLILYPNELYRVPAAYRKLRVVSGTAFVTQAARDLIVNPGREVVLSRTKDVALVSPLRNNTVIFELVSASSSSP